MEVLFEYLRQIYALLEQIYTITDNQATILLAPTEENDVYADENEALDIIAQMVDYKEELTVKLFEVEDIFQKEYNKCKQRLNNKEEKIVLELKGLVAAVLECKKDIVEAEAKQCTYYAGMY